MYKIPKGKAALGLSLALSGSLIVLPNLARAEGGQGSAAGKPPTAAEAQNAGMGSQARVSEAANEIYRVAQEDPATGYAGIVISTTGAGYTLSWKGEIPQEVASLVSTHRGKRISVSVTASKYTFKELDDQARKIIKSGVTVGGAPVVSAGASSDGNSLTIGVDSSGLPVGNALGNQKEAGAIPSSISGGMPVILTEEKSPTDVADPSARYSGPARLGFYGGQLLSTPKGVCSAGFGAYSPQTGRTYVITAEHCVKGVGDVIKNPLGETVGKVVDVQEAADSALVEVTNGSAVDWMYTGYGVGMYHSARKVRGHHQTFLGELLCTNGALMGERCGAKVIKVNQWVKSDGKERNVNQVEQIAGRYLAGSGDSGGPVFSYGVDGMVTARGILSMTSSGEACKDPRPGKKKRVSCSERAWVTGIYGNLTGHWKVAAQLRVTDF
ncbi:S1 family peptidase (plasmid) [Streptomyces sp. NBC_01426]|uniref:hypothetical protein n=1 Tax=Streptomyces sp. NBC_01426 TaxID=2975866 RepID=UPI002E33A4B5|nr:hypothetical protein [Streptomyces sp. NBC_01426]